MTIILINNSISADVCFVASLLLPSLLIPTVYFLFFCLGGEGGHDHLQLPASGGDFPTTTVTSPSFSYFCFNIKMLSMLYFLKKLHETSQW